MPECSHGHHSWFIFRQRGDGCCQPCLCILLLDTAYMFCCLLSCQGPNTPVAILLHSSRECFQESGSPWIKQPTCSAICRWWSTSAVGIKCLASLQLKEHSDLDGTFSNQMTDHSLWSAPTFDQPGLFSNHAQPILWLGWMISQSPICQNFVE